MNKIIEHQLTNRIQVAKVERWERFQESLREEYKEVVYSLWYSGYDKRQIWDFLKRHDLYFRVVGSEKSWGFKNMCQFIDKEVK